MTKPDFAQELKKEFKKGNFKPSQLKKSKSLSDLPTQTAKPLKKSKSAEELASTFNPQIEQLETKISVLELKLETQKRELAEKAPLEAENKHLKQQAKLKQQTLEELRKDLEIKSQELIQTQTELDNSLIARHQNLKDFGKEHSKRKEAETELEETIEQSAQEITNSDQTITDLRTKLFKSQQQVNNLQRELNLAKINRNSLSLTYNSPDSFNLDYFKYLVYGVITVGFVITLMRRKDD